jgi:hypothetical protein
MKTFFDYFMAKTLLVLLSFSLPLSAQWRVPANYQKIDNIDQIKLSPIGQFGLQREARPGVPAHYHTGIDILRPNSNYHNEPVFPTNNGTIVSIIDDGPYSQIVIEHVFENHKFWSVYEHIKVVVTEINREVSWNDTIGFFFNKEELHRYGWQFNHVHFEINKIEPLKATPTEKKPVRYYKTYAIVCYTKDELNARLENPLTLLDRYFVSR